ncbi:hypothetical protein SJ05684_c14230 [Sinorhizobium sojae CCBAU 05684]|uniref:Uncharacterized protein n=1 Tax=Sinorhizobium sojae CCBAU 05684 TaxID=716928 RepID=A0A249PAE6_9HYPH|nr:hypothetical protein SJ05684_c14230 [Sinorhizobium sojae CCBAU 05684]
MRPSKPLLRHFAEHERRQAFLYERHCRKENERHEQIHHLRGQFRKILPKGRKARVSMVGQVEKSDRFSMPLDQRSGAENPFFLQGFAVVQLRTSSREHAPDRCRRFTLGA